jgi:tetratricopeptide (TPR) repeat protein
MAIRLSAPAAAPPARPADLVGEAERCLRDGDAAGYRALWARAAELDGVHDRYHARKLLAERGLAAAGVTPGRLPATFALLAAELLAVLEDDPREPVLLNYAAIALYELWALDGAEALFTAARRLDGELAHVEANLAEVARRRRVPAPRLPAAVSAARAGLTERARRVAAGARPAEGLTLTLAMIVRDEEEMLPRCLAAAAPAVDEIVVVDTGSTDRTVEIAESFGARVLRHEWTGSFAAARNVSFDAATGDWIVYLDADEVLVGEDAEALRAVTGRTWREAFYLVEQNHTGDLEDGTSVVNNALRVFRNRPEYRFDGRLHEQVADKLPGHLPERLEATGVRIEHFGYLRSVRDAREKSERNITLLRAQMAEAPQVTPFLHFNLGCELAVVGDVEEAVAEFERSWELLRAETTLARHGFVPSLVSRLVKGLRAVGRLDDARACADEALAAFPGFTDIVLEQGLIAEAAGDDDAALELYARCLELGEAPSRYTSVRGSGSFLALQAAATVHRRRGDLGRAQELLERALREHPGYLGVVDPLAAVLLAQGVAPAAVVARIESGVADVTPSVHFLLGTALYEAGHVAEAEAQFAAVVERQPASGPARVALAEAQLSQARFADAAATASRIEPGDACAPAAARTELFALLAAGDHDAARAALTGPAAGALAPGDAALYRAWLAAAGGEQARPLPPVAVAPLATSLEALLRVEAFDAFELVAGLLESSGLAPRDRRELLAGVYLRRGFADLACEEWMTACEEQGPDAPALVGLAQVAAVRGMPEDALVLAEEARALAPDHPVAARLVQALSTRA